MTLDRRAFAFALSAAIHAGALAALLLWHFAPSPQDVMQALTVVDLPEQSPPEPKKPPPPPPPPQPKPTQGAASARAAGAPVPKAEAAPLAAAIPVTLPSFLPAPVPATGTAASSGAALAGTGTGAGGSGSGPGGGGDGEGNGRGGRGREGTDPEIVRGRMNRASDYPKALRGTGVQGTTFAEVVVGVNGKPLSCRIEQSSGNVLLDTQMCTLIMRRYHFRPARDPAGKAVQGIFQIDTTWTALDATEN